MKPFNLELAKQGHPVCTRDGRPARIVCFDRIGDKISEPYPILALVDIGEQEEVIAYHEDGRQTLGETSYDLFMASKKKIGWINIYIGPDVDFTPSNSIYDNEHEAEEAAFGMPNKVDTIQIEFEI